MRRLAAAAAALVLLIPAACGGDGEETEDGGSTSDFGEAEAYPIFANSEVVVGENRLLVGLLNRNDAPIGSPKTDVRITFFAPGEPETPALESDFDFVWIDEPYRGLYVGQVAFDSAGTWSAEVDIEGGGLEETLTSEIEVAAKPLTVGIGEPVPTSDTPTIDEVKDLSEITTDPHPDPDFYRTSIADAVRSGETFVAVFATPRFCTSQACGPMLEVVKEVATDFPKVTFIHVEIYPDREAAQKLEPVESVDEWQLPSEPWVFVVDDGKLIAKFEGALSPGELANELEQL